jgi:hypothetical protein
MKLKEIAQSYLASSDYATEKKDINMKLETPLKLDF